MTTMPKRPYSTQFTARGNPRRYLLSGIPPTLWDRARQRARKEHISLRQVILSLVEQWTVRPEGEPFELPAPELVPTMDLRELAAAAREVARELDRRVLTGGS